MHKNFTLSLIILITLVFSFNHSSAQQTDIPTIKALYTTAPGIVLQSGILSGVVISDSLNKNLSKGNVIFQCGNRVGQYGLMKMWQSNIAGKVDGQAAEIIQLMLALAWLLVILMCFL